MGDIQNELRRKGQIELGDKIILYSGEWMLLEQGDTYIAQVGNETPEILTMRRREVQKRRRGDSEGKVFPKERKKPLYNLHEVVKVTIIDNPNPSKEKKSDDKRELRVPGSGGDGTGRSPEGPSENPQSDGGQPRPNRPVPRAPGRKPRTDYRNAARERAAEASADVGTPGSSNAGGDDSSGRSEGSDEVRPGSD